MSTMIHQKSISTYISSIIISLILLNLPQAAMAQKDVKEDKDVPFFNGLAVSVDLVGPAEMIIGDYGQYEAGLKINLKDRYFPTVELGLGKADHDDDVTQICYKTSAPYAKVGIDFNILKNKHDIYRLDRKSTGLLCSARRL